jgi:hypothetical protein
VQECASVREGDELRECVWSFGAAEETCVSTLGAYVC